MPLASGMASQWGIATETSYGTAVTVTRFYPMVSETLANAVSRLESGGIIAGARVRRSEQWAPGAQRITGGTQLELYQQQTALLWEHMLGSIASSTASGVATHTATPGDLTGLSLTAQVGRPDTGAVVRPFTYAGVKVSEWELSVAVDEIATLGLTLMAQSETTTTALATAAYETDAARPFVFTDGSTSLQGSDACIRRMTLTGNNMLADDRWCIGDDERLEPLEMDLRTYTGTITQEFQDLDEYNAYRNASEFAIELSFSASDSAQLTVTMNARYDGQTPAVSGRGLIVVENPFVLIGDGSDADALTAVVVNAQTNP